MKKTLIIVALTIWVSTIAIGTVWITDYSTRPGKKGISPTSLPIGFGGETSSKLPKLFVFLHPQCPCSGATLKELEKLVERNPDALEINIFFYQPSNQPPEWSETWLWRAASEIPNANLTKINLEELQKFGAITSGQTLLYDADGNLVFSGGITQARGHEGPNLGSEIIEEYLSGSKPSVSEAPVFGCILTTSE
jgi:hypothetical protein